MGKKVFVSYKYADGNVAALPYNYGTTVRDYVTEFQKKLSLYGIGINKGEGDNEDLSYLEDNQIWEKLKDRIYDSSVTVVFVSPNMKEANKWEKSQWIPWEISYSLRETERNDRISRSNAIVAVVVPDKYGEYYYYPSMSKFKIIDDNIRAGYIEVVQWNSFIRNMNKYFNNAELRKKNTDKRNLTVNVR